MTDKTYFNECVRDYKEFTGQSFGKNNPESFSLFFQYLQARTLLEVRQNTIQTNEKLDLLIDALRGDR